MVDVDIEDSFEQSGPTHARRRTLRLRVIACGLGCLLCFGEVGRVLLFDEKPLLGQPPHDACDDLCK